LLWGTGRGGGLDGGRMQGVRATYYIGGDEKEGVREVSSSLRLGGKNWRGNEMVKGKGMRKRPRLKECKRDRG